MGQGSGSELWVRLAARGFGILQGLGFRLLSWLAMVSRGFINACCTFMASHGFAGLC